jgi:hypothetical protein
MEFKSNFTDRNQKRSALIRSLQDRGLINEDSSLRSLRGSLYDAIEAYVDDPYQFEPEILGDEAEVWLISIEPIYEDETLEKPDEWDVFLELLSDMCDCPEDYASGAAVYDLEQALENFPLELMLVDPAGYEFEVF